MKSVIGKTAAIALLVCIAAASVSGVSCKANPEGISVQSVDDEIPQLLSYTVADERCMELTFSKAVILKDIRIEDCSTAAVTETDIASAVARTAGDNTVPYAVTVPFGIQTECGGEYVLHGVAEDSAGNSLSFSIGFIGFNGRVPAVLLSEIRSEYSGGTNPKVEFIELYTCSAGNLAGMELTVAGDGADSRYVFPMAEVAAGEYITVHFRSVADGAGCIDETGTDLALSTAFESAADARDLWIPENTAKIGKTDVVVLRKYSGGTILDAVLFRESGKTAWPKELQRSEAAAAVAAGVWNDGGSGDTFSAAVCSDGMTATRTLSRQNVAVLAAAYQSTAAETGMYPASAADWCVVATGNATPGRENSAKPYTVTAGK